MRMLTIKKSNPYMRLGCMCLYAGWGVVAASDGHDAAVILPRRTNGELVLVRYSPRILWTQDRCLSTFVCALGICNASLLRTLPSNRSTEPIVHLSLLDRLVGSSVSCSVQQRQAPSLPGQAPVSSCSFVYAAHQHPVDGLRGERPGHSTLVASSSKAGPLRFRVRFRIFFFLRQIAGVFHF